MKKLYQSGFVADGWSRARAAVESQIQGEVERKYFHRIVAASIIQPWRINREMKKGIAERVARLAPPAGLY